MPRSNTPPLSSIGSVCVYCGASPGARPEFSDAAKELGRRIAGIGATLVYGGGNVGLMGVVADSALRAQGSVIGVIPQSLVDREVAHLEVTELKVVTTMHERKAMMETLSDVFIAMPGGFGTLDELFEILTWSQLGFHNKPIGLFNVAGYFDMLVRFMDEAVSQKFVRPEHRDLIVVDTDPARLLATLAQKHAAQAKAASA